GPAVAGCRRPGPASSSVGPARGCGSSVWSSPGSVWRSGWCAQGASRTAGIKDPDAGTAPVLSVEALLSVVAAGGGVRGGRGCVVGEGGWPGCQGIQPSPLMEDPCRRCPAVGGVPGGEPGGGAAPAGSAGRESGDAFGERGRG